MNNRLDKNYSIQSVHRAIGILKSFSNEKSSLTLTELNDMTGISKPALQRILATLVYEGFLQKDEYSKKYQLGLELYFLGSLVQKESSLLNAALPVMQSIRDETGEAVTLNMIYNNKRRCIGSCESKQALSALTLVGHESPLYAGASAKILLAYLSEEEIDKYLSGIKMEAITSNTITEINQIKDELQDIRSRGYAISYGERVKGTFSLSAPVFYPAGQAAAGISIVIPTVRAEEFNLDQLIKLIISKTTELSNRLNQSNRVLERQ